MEARMPTFKMPLSGDVTQTINPWTFFFNPVGSQFGLVNINLGTSSNPDVEQAVLEDVASYGKQLGRIGDVLSVLLDHFHPQTPLKPKEEQAIADLRALLAQIAQVKAKYPPASPP
jgi:hypothetical protein